MKKTWGAFTVLLAMGLAACGSDDGSKSGEKVSADDAGADDDSADDDTSGDDDSADDDSADDDTNADDDSGADDDTSDDDTGDDDTADAGPDDGNGVDAGTDAGTTQDGGAGEGDAGGLDAGTEPTQTDAAASDAGPLGCGTPAELGTFAPATGAAQGFVVDGDRAYVTATSAGVYVVDISNPSAPVSLGQYDTPSGRLAFRVAVEGNIIALAQRGNGWVLLDQTDVENITPLGMNESVTAEDVALSADVLYYADGNGVQSVDVSDPSAPVPLTTDLVLPGNSRQILVDGSTVYVASQGTGISVLDASDPSALAELGSLDVGNGSTHIALSGSLLYAAHSKGVTVIDVSDGTQPTAVGEYTRDRANELTLLDDHLFVFGDDTATVTVPFVSVVNVADPSAPIDEGSDLDTYAGPVFARVAGDLLLASVDDDGSLHLFQACPDL